LEAAGEGVVATLASTALSHREMIDALHGIQANVEREATLADRDYAPLVRRMIARGVTPPKNPN
jgi:hypothetical protein